MIIKIQEKENKMLLNKFDENEFKKILKSVFPNKDTIIFMYSHSHHFYCYWYEQGILKKEYSVKINEHYIENDINKLFYLIEHNLLLHKNTVIVSNQSIDGQEFLNFYSLTCFQKLLLKYVTKEWFLNFYESLFSNKNFSLVQFYYHIFLIDFLQNSIVKETLNKLFIRLKNVNTNHVKKDNLKNLAVKMHLNYVDCEEFNDKYTLTTLPNYKFISQFLHCAIPIIEKKTNKKVLAIHNINLEILDYYFDEIIFISEKLLIQLLFADNNFLKFPYSKEVNTQFLFTYCAFSDITSIILKKSFNHYSLNLINETKVVKEQEINETMYHYLSSLEPHQLPIIKDTIQFTIQKNHLSDYYSIIEFEKLNLIDDSTINNGSFSKKEKEFIEKLKEVLIDFNWFEIGYVSKDIYYTQTLTCCSNKDCNYPHIKKVIEIN